MARLGGPQLVARRRPQAGVEQLERAHDPLRVGRRDGGRRGRVAGGQLGVQGLRPAGFQVGAAALADGGRDGRAQVELGERGAQIEAGAADHDRPPARGEQGVDLARGRAARSGRR